MSTAATGTLVEGPLAQAIRVKLTTAPALKPLLHCIIQDNSHQHAHHAAMKALRRQEGGDSPRETHFHLTLVSEAFATLPSLMKRHALVYGLLDQEFKNGLHSVQMITKTPNEYEAHSDERAAS